MDVFYYSNDKGERVGPVKVEDAANHIFSSKTLVWYPGLSEWVPASSVPELKNYVMPDLPPVDGSKGHKVEKTVEEVSPKADKTARPEPEKKKESLGDKLYILPNKTWKEYLEEKREKKGKAKEDSDVTPLSSKNASLILILGLVGVVVCLLLAKPVCCFIAYLLSMSPFYVSLCLGVLIVIIWLIYMAGNVKRNIIKIVFSIYVLGIAGGSLGILYDLVDGRDSARFEGSRLVLRDYSGNNTYFNDYGEEFDGIPFHDTHYYVLRKSNDKEIDKFGNKERKHRTRIFEHFKSGSEVEIDGDNLPFVYESD